MVEHALGPLGLPEVLAEVDEGNEPSIRVIERFAVRGSARPGRPDGPVPQDPLTAEALASRAAP